MLPGSTLFVAVCAQRDFWPGGAWPLVDDETAANVAALVALAAQLRIRAGGVCCLHDAATHAPPSAAASSPSAAGLAPHCVAGSAGAAVAPGCAPALPMEIVAARPLPTLDRGRAYYVASGCGAAVDGDPLHHRVFDHLTAGVRDAVVFGAGVEYALAHAVEALLRRRVRTHVALDAAAAADPAAAQAVIARWKRRGVDGATAATLARLLQRAGAPGA